MNRHLTLQSRLVIVISVLLVATAAFLWSFFPARMEALGQRWSERRAESMTRVLARVMRSALEFNDDEYARSILEAMSSSGAVSYAVVTRHDGKVLARLNTKSPPDLKLPSGPEPALRERDKAIHVVIGIQNGEEPGKLSIGFSLDELHQEMSENRRTVGIAVSALVFIGLLVSLAIGVALTRQIRVTSSQVAGASTDILAASQEQEVAGAQQSASVEEVRRTVESLLEAAGHIAQSAVEVTATAERTRETTDETATKIRELSAHAGRISEILETIRDIADRTDLLALNAALEATRAGEAGRSFSLVASEMRKLAERVTSALVDVRSLVADIRTSSAATVIATEDNCKLIESTTDSAKQITLAIQQQRTATAQVSQSMVEIAQVVTESVAAAHQIRSSAEGLKRDADDLARLVGKAAGATS